MFFKNQLTALMSLLLLTSCGMWGGDNQVSPTAKVNTQEIFEGKSVDCIMNSGRFFADYFQGHSSELEINEMTDCISNTLDTMFKMAYKEDGQGFNRQRVENILRSVSKDRSKNYEEVSNLIFLIKRFFIGGSKDRFVKSEWRTFEQELPKISQILIDANPSIKLIFFSEKRRDLKRRMDDYDNLKRSFQALDTIRNRHSQKLSRDEFIDLVHSILKVSHLEKFLPIFNAAMPVAIPNEEYFEKAQSTLFDRVWTIFIMQSRFRELHFNEGFMSGESLADLVNATRMIYQNLYGWSLEDEDNFKFKILDVKNIMSSLFDLGLFNDVLSETNSLNQTVENLFLTFFGSEEIDHTALRKFRYELSRWTEGYNFLLKDYHFDWVPEVRESLANHRVLVEDVEELEEAVTNFNKPKFINGSGKPIRIMYDRNSELNEKEKFFDVSLKHLLLSVSTSLMKIYQPTLRAGDRRDIDILVNRDVLRRLFYDFRPIGLAMGFVNPYSCDSVDRIFMEGNSFTFSGNGDSHISIYEAAEWLGTMISVSSISNHVFRTIDESCMYNGVQNFGYNFVKRSCFRDVLLERSSTFADFFPGFSTYLDIMRSESLIKEYVNKTSDVGGWFLEYPDLNLDGYKSLLANSMNTCKLAGEQRFQDFPMSRGEFNTVVAVLLYVENIFQQFDTTGLEPNLKFWKEDPKGYDYIIDGRELSELITSKFTVEMQDMTASFLANFEQGGFKHKLTLGALKNLPEYSVKLERQRMFSIASDFLFDSSTINGLETQFCTQVMESAERDEVIDFDEEASLQCEKPE